MRPFEYTLRKGILALAGGAPILCYLRSSIFFWSTKFFPLMR